MVKIVVRPKKNKVAKDSIVPRPLSKQRTFNLIYSTNWHCRPSELRALQGLPLELQEATRRLSAAQPLCCDLTNRSFCRLLCQVASQLGFTVKRWPVEDAPGCWALTKAAKRGELKDTSAMMLHSWHGGYEKECVPSWDFYPLLEALKRRSLVVYPSPELDLLHSAKRYRSKFMAPTEFLTMQRHGHTWKANGKDLAVATRKALKDLHSAALAVGLGTENVMLKQVLQYLSTVVLPKLPAQAVELTVLLQAKVDLVAELRWMVLNGELRGCGWVTLPVPRLGRKANSGCYKNELACREALEKLKLDRLKLEESIRPKVEAVVQEAVYDAGVMPQYLRVDFLVDKQGRAWLGERESWGADLVRNQENPQGRAPYSHDLPSFTATVRRVLAALSAADPAGANCLARRVAGRGWYFQFAREPIFVTTFAPCYDEKNPRYQFQQHPESCFILFQPEESFLRHDLPNDKPRSQTNWEHPVDVRDRIRANFLRHGREYRIPETTSYPPAEFIVAPPDVLKDPPVHFWLEGSAPSGR